MAGSLRSWATAVVARMQPRITATATRCGEMDMAEFPSYCWIRRALDTHWLPASELSADGPGRNAIARTTRVYQKGAGVVTRQIKRRDFLKDASALTVGGSLLRRDTTSLFDPS